MSLDLSIIVLSLFIATYFISGQFRMLVTMPLLLPAFVGSYYLMRIKPVPTAQRKIFFCLNCLAGYGAIVAFIRFEPPIQSYRAIRQRLASKHLNIHIVKTIREVMARVKPEDREKLEAAIQGFVRSNAGSDSELLQDAAQCAKQELENSRTHKLDV